MKDILITSTVLIAAILLIRSLFRSTISRRTQYALWLLVALRLLIPANLPAMEHNVLSAAEKTETVQNFEALRGVGQIWHTEPGTVEGYERGVLMPETPVTVAENIAPERFERMRTALEVRDVLEPLWYAGMAVMALWFLAANLRFARRLRRTRVPLDGAESRYPVYLCDDIPSPCLFGLLRPAIYVTSAAAKDETRLRFVIAHEETHARHLDPLWSLVRGVCLVIWWFDPLVWLAAYCARADCELACDEGTLARLGESERASYGETLLSLIPVRRGGDPMLAATTMTAGKRQMKERIQRIAEHKRPLAVALVLALALSGVVCAATFTGAKKAEAAGRATSGAYASVEDYLAAVRAETASVTYPAADGGEKTANVLDTRAFLDMEAELPGLAPNGTLALYRYMKELKLEAPPEDAALVGGMYAEDELWYDLEGMGGHSLVVLRYDDGSVDVLFDQPNNDDRGGLYHYEETAEEILYDFYVKEYGLDLPLYTVDLALGGENKAPAHRVDGDGWYVYIPVQGWYRADEGGTARWCSRYNTGSTISIREASREELDAERPQLAAGQAERFVEASDGRIWLVWTQYDPSLLIRSDMTGLEPAVLDAMARSFTVIADASPQQTAATLPRYKYQGGDPYLAAVCEWSVKRGEQARYWEAQVTVPCPLIADVDDSNAQDIRVWGNFWSFSYTPRATTLFCVSGGENPGLLHLRPTENGYEVFNEEMVGDGEAYGKDMQRIFGALRLLKLDALDREEVRARFLDDYVRWNALSFTQYQDYGWAPVQFPNAPETPEAAQLVRYAAPSGWSIDYDLREFSVYEPGELELSLGGVGEWKGIGIDIEEHPDTAAAELVIELSEQMERPARTETAVGAENTPATLLRDGAKRSEVVRDVYVVSLPGGGSLCVRLSNTYYNTPGDPIVSGADTVLQKTLATFRLASRSSGAWRAEELSPAPPLTPPDAEISMELVSADKNNGVTAALSNHGGEAYLYGEDYSLQVKLKGTWYVVPTTPDQNWGFTAQANILRPGETAELDCPLVMFGDLPGGTYRIVREGLAAEFEVK